MTPSEISAILISLKVAAIAVAASLPAGVLLGWLLARKSFFGKSLVETMVNLPLVLPPVVTGYLLLVAFGRQGVLGSFLESAFGWRLIFDWKGAALAAAIVAFPLMVRSIRVAILSVDPRLEHASRTLGVGPVRTFFSVTLPLARHGVVAGAVLAFARCLGEFGATIMVAGNIPGTTQTIPLKIYNQLEVPGGLEDSWRIVLFSIAMAAAALFLGDWMDRRHQERLVR